VSPSISPVTAVGLDQRQISLQNASEGKYMVNKTRVPSWSAPSHRQTKGKGPAWTRHSLSKSRSFRLLDPSRKIVIHPETKSSSAPAKAASRHSL
jgi:hypothetical protein